MECDLNLLKNDKESKFPKSKNLSIFNKQLKLKIKESIKHNNVNLSSNSCNNIKSNILNADSVDEIIKTTQKNLECFNKSLPKKFLEKEVIIDHKKLAPFNDYLKSSKENTLKRGTEYLNSSQLNENLNKTKEKSNKIEKNSKVISNIIIPDIEMLKKHINKENKEPSLSQRSKNSKLSSELSFRDAIKSIYKKIETQNNENLIKKKTTESINITSTSKFSSNSEFSTDTVKYFKVAKVKDKIKIDHNASTPSFIKMKLFDDKKQQRKETLEKVEIIGRTEKQNNDVPKSPKKTDLIEVNNCIVNKIDFSFKTLITAAQEEKPKKQINSSTIDRLNQKLANLKARLDIHIEKSIDIEKLVNDGNEKIKSPSPLNKCNNTLIKSPIEKNKDKSPKLSGKEFFEKYKSHSTNSIIDKKKKKSLNLNLSLYKLAKSSNKIKQPLTLQKQENNDIQNIHKHIYQNFNTEESKKIIKETLSSKESSNKNNKCNKFKKVSYKRGLISNKVLNTNKYSKEKFNHNEKIIELNSNEKPQENDVKNKANNIKKPLIVESPLNNISMPLSYNLLKIMSPKEKEETSSIFNIINKKNVILKENKELSQINQENKSSFSNHISDFSKPPDIFSDCKIKHIKTVNITYGYQSKLNSIFVSNDTIISIPNSLVDQEMNFYQGEEFEMTLSEVHEPSQYSEIENNNKYITGDLKQLRNSRIFNPYKMTYSCSMDVNTFISDHSYKLTILNPVEDKNSMQRIATIQLNLFKQNKILNKNELLKIEDKMNKNNHFNSELLAKGVGANVDCAKNNFNSSYFFPKKERGKKRDLSMLSLVNIDEVLKKLNM